MVVQPLRQGTPEELVALAVDDLQGDEVHYYVDLEITNLSTPETGGDFEPNNSFQLIALQPD